MYKSIEIKTETTGKYEIKIKVYELITKKEDEKEFVKKCRMALNNALVAAGINLD